MEGGAIFSSLPNTTKSAREAAEAAGEGLPVFVARAVRHKRGGTGQ